MDKFSNLYPVTKTRNVIDNNGKALSGILEEMQIDSGLIESDTGSKKTIGEYIKLPTGFFVFYYPEIELKIISQPLYHRGTVHFPFDVDTDKYSVVVTLGESDITHQEIGHVYVRNKYTDGVQVSTVNKIEQDKSDIVTCNIVVVGRV